VIDGQLSTISGTGMPGDKVTLAIGGSSVDLVVGSDGRWSHTPATPLSSADLVLSVTAIDALGNVATDERRVVSLTAEDQVPGNVEMILVNEAGLSDGTTPSNGAASAQSSLFVGTSDGAIGSLVIGGVTTSSGIAGGTIIPAAMLMNVTTTPIAPIATSYGSVTVTGYNAATGVVSYTYTLADNSNTPDVLRETVEIAVIDQDGDIRATTLEIAIQDDAPVIALVSSAAAAVNASEADLSVNPSASFAGLFTVNHGADGAAAANATVYALSVASASSGLIDTATGEAIVLTLGSDGSVSGRTATGGVLAFQISLDAATGAITLDQTRALSHPDGSSADTVTLPATALVLTATATDGDGDSTSQSATIGDRISFTDDLPVTATSVNSGFTLPTLTALDSDTIAGPDVVAASFAAAFQTSTDFGNDGAATSGATVWAYSLSLQSGGTSVASGLFSQGDAITLYQVGAQIIGSTAANSGAIAAANTVFTLDAAATGSVTLRQYLSIDHGNTLSSSETVALASDLVRLTGAATVTDGDGDKDVDTSTIDIGDRFVFTDDGPVVTATPSASVDEAGLRAVSGTSVVSQNLSIAIGGDREAGTKFVTFNASQTALEALGLSSAGVALGYVITGGTTLTASAGGVNVFTVVLTQPSSGNSFTPSYTFTLLAPLDHVASGTGALLDAVTLNFALTATDSDGDAAQANFDVVVADDVPTAVSQSSVSVTEGGAAIGSAVSGVNLLANDTQGGDTARIYQVSYADNSGTTQTVTIGALATDTGPLDTRYGTLTVYADGRWSYTPDAVAIHTNSAALSDPFSYTLIDGDGDISAAVVQPIAVNDTLPVAVNDTDRSIVEGASIALTGNVI
jgi:large repetitive protein